MCAGHTLLPKSLHFELPGGTMGDVQYKSGSADVSRRKFGDGAVAIKELRPHGLPLEEMTNRFCKEVITWNALRHPNVLPLLGVAMSENRFFMFSVWMENGNIKEFTAAHQDANRLQLLEDVARGLIHMHGQGMVHGDLKGANILIDRNRHACLTDFGLLTITSGTTNIASSNSFRMGGTYRWMSPELFDPEMFNLKDSRPTKSSDRYAFGMVIYEVLSGQIPFYKHPDFTVVAKVLKGKRPVRPQGAEAMLFTDGVWSILECCWNASPGDRPKIKDVLQSLEQVSKSWAPPPPRITAYPDTSMTWDPSESCTEESTDELSSASRMVSPQSSQRLERQGNPKRNYPCPHLPFCPSALSNDASGHRALGTTPEELGGSGATERIFDSVSRVGLSNSVHC
ncbi:kinase-like domain-containing protein [Thelephora terrestris]|uniref:Kinase-like domain-containing protein n=1 Tax=Thelephora terrestris TaxID=56493 RepID=A0A9P6H914_9AGAM|nr:kinase-like domain-containing protein [Thelephora terrestris]